MSEIIPIDILLGIILGISIAVSGVKEAYDKNEQIKWVLFWKTIALAFVSAGLLQAARADMLIQILGTPVLTELMDTFFNAIVNKWKHTRNTEGVPST